MPRSWSGTIAKEARDAAGLDRQEAADRLGVHLATVYAWEAGREPQLRFASGMAELYGVTLDSFFVHEDNGRVRA